MSVDDLANGYVQSSDNNDEVKRSFYFAALMLRFWYKIEKMYLTCHSISGYDREDCAALLAECINIACQYRGWLDETKHLNAQQCINQVIGTRGAPAVIYEYNRGRRMANVNTTSLDDTSASDNDEVSMLDAIEDDSDYIGDTESNAAVTSIIQRYINQDKIVEAIILDTIAFNDTIRYTTKKVKQANADGETQEYKQSFAEFWPHKCVQLLAKLPGDYDKYFKSKYYVKTEILDAGLQSVRTAPNQKLYRYLRSTLKDCKKNLAI